MELIYSYVHSCWGEQFDLGLNFSHKFDIEFSPVERKIKITKKQDESMDNFFGGSISNVTAIVGRNGVGKSTILNMLGLQRLDHNDLYRSDEAIWFCLYHIEGEYFAIEGGAPKGFFNDAIQHLRDGYFAYTLNEFDGELFYNDFLQEYRHDFQNSTVVLYNPTSRVRNRFEREYGNYGFKRAYINRKNSYLYYFLFDGATNFGFDIKRDFLLKVPTSFKNNRIKSGGVLKLFDDKDFYTEDVVPFPGHKDKSLLIDDIKKNYILHLIEIIINDYFVEAIKPTESDFLDESVEESSIKLFSEAIGGVYKGDMRNYEKIKEYLEEIMLRFRGVVKEIIGVEEEANWLEVIDFLESFPKEWFSRKGHYYLLSIPCTPGNLMDEAIYLMDEIEKKHFVTSVRAEPPLMSSGQQALAFKLSSIHAELTFQIMNERVDNIILLVDEYEEHLHPEWTRLFFSHLVKLIEGFKEYATVQIIIATHSPYIISDLPKNNIIKINYSDNKRVVEKCHFGFASNIYDIVCDSFFLNNTMGEFAYKKINEMIVYLNSNDELSKAQYNSYRYLVNIIDDDYLKSNLQLLIDAKAPVNALQSEITKLEERIALLNERLKK